MRMFIAKLNKGSIPYVIASDGTINCKVKDEAIVNEIHEKLRRKLASSNAVKYEDAF
jgi:hypothetical protein